MSKIPAILKPISRALISSIRKPKKKEQLTQQELQQLSAMLRNGIIEAQEFIQAAKTEASVNWSAADKNNPETQMNFELFSSAHRLQKYAEQQLRKMENIQGKIKRLLRA